MNRFTNKVVLLTGASRGIGAQTARRFAAEGAKVAVVYGASADAAHAVVAEIEAAGGIAKAFHGDALVPANMAKLKDEVLSTFGQIDILVNNAGIFEGGMIGNSQITDLDRIIDVNIKSVYALTEAVAPVLPEGGRIVNLSSCLGERGTFAGASMYTMSKFAVSGLTRAWAWDLADRKITVNAVLPGPIETDMGNPDAAGITALKRLGLPDEVAASVLFLASDEASYITGAQLAVDGGANA
ncbi:SDR family NAD(P)-dependent oxidoreductase [Glaciecola siphonariae]|uniref:SDR family NAD(P)-dependent oxidoreductase n=1 Tax=Glaciecola siphonariae TaxID=521012 RepID=A0ABV9LXK2_9ALTE